MPVQSEGWEPLPDGVIESVLDLIWTAEGLPSGDAMALYCRESPSWAELERLGLSLEMCKDAKRGTGVFSAEHRAEVLRRYGLE